MSILSHEYQGDGVYDVRTTSGWFEVDLYDPLGKRAEVREFNDTKQLYEGSNDQCREWLEANT